MDKNKVEVSIGSQSYTIVSDKAPEVIIALSNDINEKLKEIMSSGRISLTQALVLASFDFACTAKDSTAEAKLLKSEIGEYLESAEQAMTERDRLKRENDRLKEKIKGLNS
jgi:cell division protein ZapA (FtsZ GTPase activity inhibitor)